MTVRIRLEELGDRDASLEVERAAFGSDEEAAVIAKEDFMLVALAGAPLAGAIRWHPAFGQAG